MTTTPKAGEQKVTGDSAQVDLSALDEPMDCYLPCATEYSLHCRATICRFGPGRKPAVSGSSGKDQT